MVGSETWRGRGRGGSREGGGEGGEQMEEEEGCQRYRIAPGLQIKAWMQVQILILWWLLQ